MRLKNIDISGNGLTLLITTYRRAINVQNILRLSINQGLTKILVYADGPKDNDFSVQKQIGQFIDELKRKNPGIEILFRKEKNNQGCALSVIKAIDWLFQETENGVILEDDCIPGPDFFNYVRMALPLVNKLENCKTVSGCQFAEIPLKESWFTSKYPMFWGWATTRDVWREMRESFSGRISHRERLIRNFFTSEYNFWKSGNRRALQGFVDTWDLPLAYWMFKNNYLTIVPKENLVTNIGDDVNATHTKNPMFILNFANDGKFNDPTSLPGYSPPIDDYIKRRVYHISGRHFISTKITYLKDLFRLNKPVRGPLKLRVKICDLSN